MRYLRACQPDFFADKARLAGLAFITPLLFPPFPVDYRRFFFFSVRASPYWLLYRRVNRASRPSLASILIWFSASFYILLATALKPLPQRVIRFPPAYMGFCATLCPMTIETISPRGLMPFQCRRTVVHVIVVIHTAYSGPHAVARIEESSYSNFPDKRYNAKIMAINELRARG